MDWLLSVDPGTHSAWALWRRDNEADSWSLVASGRLEAPDAPEVFALLGELSAPDGPVDWARAHVVVEGQWYRPPTRGRDGAARYHSADFGSVMTLIESRCAWIDAAAIAGAQTEVVPPGEWIPAATKGAPGATSTERVAAMARWWMPGLRMVGADEPAAVLLGIWWLRERRQRIVRVMEPAA